MRKFYQSLAVAVLALMTTTAVADSITKPSTFTAGQPALASEVNANFDTVYDQVNKVGTEVNIDAVNHRVGIGTAIPDTKLHIDGDVTVTNGNISLRTEGRDPYIELNSDDASDSTTMRLKSLDAVGFAVTNGNDLTRMVVTETGNVGIGKTNPATALDVQGTVTATSFSGDGSGLNNVNAASAASVAWGDITSMPVDIADGDANTTYSGADFATSNQNCPPGQKAWGIDATGALICGTDAFKDDDADKYNEVNSAMVLNRNTLELTDAGGTLTADLSPLKDNLGDHTATKNIILGSHYLSGDGGNEGILVDSVGKVGIGASSTGAKLYVSNPDVAQAAYFKNANAANNLPAVYADTSGTGQAVFGLNQGTGRAGHFQIFNAASSASALRAETNGTGYAGDFLGNLHVDGNVGIGTATPAETLDVAGTLQVRPFNYLYTHDGGGGIASGNYNTCPCNTTSTDVECPQAFLTNTDRGAECYDLYGGGPDYAYWKFVRSEAPPLIQTQASGNTQLGANSITIIPGGKVGIGDIDPVSALDVTGDFAVKSNNYTYVYSGEAPFMQLPRCSCDIDSGDQSQNQTSGIDCVSPVITDQDDGPECYDRYVQANYSTGYPDPHSKKYKRYDMNSYYYPPVVFVDASLGRLGIGTQSPNAELDVRGDINYTGGLTNISDKRLKENITPITDALTIVEAINGVYYNKIATPDRPEAGVLAQDVQTVLPEAVSVIDPENGYLGVSYNMLIPVLVEAVKELKVKNDIKDQKIEALTDLVCLDRPEAGICQ